MANSRITRIHRYYTINHITSSDKMTTEHLWDSFESSLTFRTMNISTCDTHTISQFWFLKILSFTFCADRKIDRWIVTENCHTKWGFHKIINKFKYRNISSDGRRDLGSGNSPIYTIYRFYRALCTFSVQIVSILFFVNTTSIFAKEE